MFIRKVTQLLIYLAVRSVICWAQAIAPETAQKFAPVLAWVAHSLLKVRRKVVEENLCIAYPQLGPQDREQLALKMWEHLALLGYEMLMLRRKIHHTNWRDHIRLVNHVPALRMLSEGRPVVFVTGHFGNFELGGYALGLLGVPTWTVARPIDNPYLDRFIQQLRAATGQRLIPKQGATEWVNRLAAAGEPLAFLADQSAGPKGCFVEFFGRKASTFKAIALLALTHQCPLAVCYAIRKPRILQFELCIAAVLDPKTISADWANVPTITQWFTTELEQAIRSCPEQYWWVHRRWKDAPPRERKSSAKAA